jgi:hypothetical protein
MGVALTLLLSPHPAANAAGNATAARHPTFVATLATPAGEHDVEITDFRFVYFKTSYRHTRAPREEISSGERVEIVSTRDDCHCVRLADYSRIKMKSIREIAITYSPGDRVAAVRITRTNGSVKEYPATSLYGGTGLFPPQFSATIDGVTHEFPLVLEGREDAAWPEETLVRVLLSRTTQPAPPKGHHH